MRNLFLLSLLFVTVLSCKEKTTYEIDDELIQEYLAKTNINATKHSSGLYYIIEKEGNGTFPILSSDPNAKLSNVEVKYYGYYLDSIAFDKGINPITSPLISLYQGWQIGIPLFSKGGSGKLFLPRHLAKGSAVMIFDIELRDVF